MMRSTIHYIIMCLLLQLWTQQAVADLTFSQTGGGFPLVTDQGTAVFLVDEGDAEVVRTVARCVIRDLKTVTGRQPALLTAVSAKTGVVSSVEKKRRTVRPSLPERVVERPLSLQAPSGSPPSSTA